MADEWREEFGEEMLKAIHAAGVAAEGCEDEHPIIATTLRYWVGKVNRARLQDMGALDELWRGGLGVATIRDSSMNETTQIDRDDARAALHAGDPRLMGMGTVMRLLRDASRLAQIAPLVTWQPIEVAPKDGTVVLLRVPDPDVRYAFGFWDDGWIDFAKVDHDDVRRIRAEGKEAPFVFGTPTYWLAFPDAPDAGEEWIEDDRSES